MKIEPYSLNNLDSNKIKEFLKQNLLSFKKIFVKQSKFNKSYLKITYSHRIHIIDGYQEHTLIKLLKHINKYHRKMS